MITLIAALYVILPALLALAAVLYASFCPVTLVAEEEQASSDDVVVFKVQRDSHAAKAIAAIKLYKQTASRVWYDYAMLHWQCDAALAVR